MSEEKNVTRIMELRAKIKEKLKEIDELVGEINAIAYLRGD